MSNDLAIANLPQTFRETLREKVMAATLDLIPKEVPDSYISPEDHELRDQIDRLLRGDAASSTQGQ